MPYKDKNKLMEYREKYYSNNRDTILEKSRMYYMDNLRSSRAIQKEYRENNRKAIQERKLGVLYNIPIGQYDKMLMEQNNKCAICSTHQSFLKKTLSVDHDHETGKTRGLLCQRCNTAIGMLKDSIDLLDKAKSYLQKYDISTGG
jgi:hypothetical protein